MNFKSITLHLDSDQRTFSLPSPLAQNLDQRGSSLFRSTRTSCTTFDAHVRPSVLIFPSSPSLFFSPSPPFPSFDTPVTPPRPFIPVTPVTPVAPTLHPVTSMIHPGRGTTSKYYTVHKLGRYVKCTWLLYPILISRTFQEQLVLVIVVSCLRQIPK